VGSNTETGGSRCYPTIVAIAIILQLGFLPAYPFWAMVAIAFHVIIIYALSVYGGRRQAD
jgi:hypothetical protein